MLDTFLGTLNLTVIKEARVCFGYVDFNYITKIVPSQSTPIYKESQSQRKQKL